jgi:peroxiredoxin
MKKFLLSGLVAVAALAVSFTLAGPAGLKVGDTAQDFKLKNVDGKEYGLADFKKAKGYIVIFTCNACPYAKAYEDRIIALHRKYEPLGYPVVAINPNDKNIVAADSYENMIKRAKEKKVPFVYLYDETQAIATAYGAARTPHVYLLDKDRVVRYIGAIDDNSEEPEAVQEPYLENAIMNLMNGQEVKVPETKAIGCTIKWKRS